VDIQLAEVEGCVSGMRVNFASALETIMPVKHVAGSKFTGELSKAVFASEDGLIVIGLQHWMRILSFRRVNCNYVGIW